MSSCTTCRIRNIYTPMSLDMNRINVLRSWSMMATIFRSYFLIRLIWEKLLSCRTFVIPIGLIQIFSNSLHSLYKYTQTIGNILIGYSGVNHHQHNMPFPNFKRIELRHGATFLTGCFTVVKNWKNCMHKINKR